MTDIRSKTNEELAALTKEILVELRKRNVSVCAECGRVVMFATSTSAGHAATCPTGASAGRDTNLVN